VRKDGLTLPDGYDLYIFDVDGTLVRTKSGKEFRDGAADWELLPGRKEVLAALKARGAKIGLATNQGGVAFGYLDEEGVWDAMLALAREVGADALRCCPFHPGGTVPRFRQDSPDRKPRPGMLLGIMGELGVTPGRTLMVGDRDEDRGAAGAAGCDFAWARDFFGEAGAHG
jgi:D-glycero-D-manno-heptose 1,7-bisphosphate phosphatase